jgi:hypothetical protein
LALGAIVLCIDSSDADACAEGCHPHQHETAAPAA